MRRKKERKGRARVIWRKTVNGLSSHSGLLGTGEEGSKARKGLSSCCYSLPTSRETPSNKQCVEMDTIPGFPVATHISVILIKKTQNQVNWQRQEVSLL